MATKFNEIFALSDLRQVVEWRANLCFKVTSVLVTGNCFFLPNVCYYGRSFILNVIILKPSAIRCNIQNCIFSRSVSVVLLYILITMNSLQFAKLHSLSGIYKERRICFLYDMETDHLYTI